jgi:hypothetical protein
MTSQLSFQGLPPRLPESIRPHSSKSFFLKRIENASNQSFSENPANIAKTVMAFPDSKS